MHIGILYISADISKNINFYDNPVIKCLLQSYKGSIRLVVDKYLDNNTIVSLDPDICKILKQLKEVINENRNTENRLDGVCI